MHVYLCVTEGHGSGQLRHVPPAAAQLLPGASFRRFHTFLHLRPFHRARYEFRAALGAATGRIAG